MDPKISASLTRALTNLDFRDFLERASPAMGLPGTAPRFDAVREIASALLAERGRGRELVRALGASDREEARLISAVAFGNLALEEGRREEAMAALQELAGDSHAVVRAGVIDALKHLFTTDAAATFVDVKPWLDGFLQAHVILEALRDRKVLTALPRSEPVLEILDTAFALADNAPRAADRWQGVRTLRAGLPKQITAFVGRFPTIFDWLKERAAATRPETREVIETTLAELHRASFKKGDVEALRSELAKSAKAPRDPSRIVHGTRKRSKR
ncbi:MAG: hypothetical protein IPK82_33505 [Polyangiaceae bacterium]|nr:hypothetical protein [Polyangiaceae bacterium]